MACSCFLMPMGSAKSRSMSTRCGSKRGNCGGTPPVRPTLYTSICGMIILKPRDSVTNVAPALTKALPRLPRDNDGPVFAEPWQASAFAMAVCLSKQGHFTWSEWADTPGEELKANATRGEPDDGSRYYHCWLAALERLVVSKRLSDRAALLARKEAWADAYRHTPHGQPVKLDPEGNS